MHPSVGIIVDQVSFSYAGPRIVDSLSCHARPGEFLAILGPNGCGKSTLLRLMAGLCRPSHGEIHIDGHNVSNLGRKALARRIAFLTQMASPPPNIIVHEMIAMGRYAHQTLLSRRSREDEERISEAVLTMQVQPLLDRRVGTLSGGQLQRCRMAMALAQGSGTLLLDEPTTYLDMKYQFGILECARDQARSGKTVVAVLHDFTHASLYADRVAVMSEGQMAGIGHPNDILTEDMVARVFDVRTRVAHAHGAIFHVPSGAHRE